MTRFLIGLFSLLLMICLPALIQLQAAPPLLAFKDNPLKWVLSSRVAYHNILVQLSPLKPTAVVKPVEVYAWRDSDGNQHFSDKPPSPDKSPGRVTKSQTLAENNTSPGRLAFAPAWVLGFMVLVWVLIYLVIWLIILGVNKARFSLFTYKARRRIANEQEPPRVKVWRDVDIESTEPHQILGISPNASIEEIKRAYRNVIKQYHPDRVATMGEEIQILADRKAAAINEAYERMMKNKKNK